LDPLQDVVDVVERDGVKRVEITLPFLKKYLVGDALIFDQLLDIG